MDNLRERWANGDVTLGAWLSVPSAVSAEVTARTGFDYVCVDNQHGVFDYLATVGTITAITLGGSTPVVRVPWNEPGIVGKMLDAGARAVIAPMINTADEARALVRACRFPPLGARSYGPAMAALRERFDPAEANAYVAVLPMIETAEALANVEAIVSVPGVDGVYIGPSDLSLSLGLAPTNNDDRAVFTEALERVVTACRKHGVIPGVHSTGALAARRREQGFQIITVAADLGALRSGLQAELQSARA